MFDLKFFAYSLVCTIAAFLTLTAEAQQSANSFRIDNHRAGPVTVGMNAYDLYDMFSIEDKELIDLHLEGSLSPALVLKVRAGEEAGEITAEIGAIANQLVVTRISISDPVFRTDKGIGVGSTVGDLRGAYDLSWVDVAEGGVYVGVDELGASFALDQSGPDGTELWRIRDAQKIPSDVKIAVILLTE